MLIILGLGLGVLSSLIASAVWDRFSNRLPSVSGNKDFSISGIWVAVLNTKNTNTPTFEILRLRERHNSVSIYIENYHSQRKSVIRCRGAGIHKSLFISAFYYSIDKMIPVSGALTLLSRSTCDLSSSYLTGVYVTYSDRVDSKDAETILATVSNPYTLRRIQIGLVRQLGVFFGRTYFNTYHEVRGFILRTFPDEHLAT
jgi:hypothetical protein